MNSRLMLALLCLALLTGCGASSASNSNAVDEAAYQHAQTAGMVLTRSLDPEPSRWAAYAVLGTVGDTTIEALQAEGTTYDGTVVLKITVDQNSGQFNSARSVRCYRYRLAHTTDDATPQQLDCPAIAPLRLAAPPAAPDLSSAGARKLTAVLMALSPAERTDQAAVRTAVTKAFGPPAIVTVGPQSSGISINTRAGKQCLLAMLAPIGAPTVRPVHGSDCRGG